MEILNDSAPHSRYCTSRNFRFFPSDATMFTRFWKNLVYEQVMFTSNPSPPRNIDNFEVGVLGAILHIILKSSWLNNILSKKSTPPILICLRVVDAFN